MKQPIQAGDACKVIYPDSSNYGKTVVAVSFQGEHSKWGRMWRCSGENLEHHKPRDGGFLLDWADFPAAWLEKALPLPTKAKQLETT